MRGYGVVNSLVDYVLQELFAKAARLECFTISQECNKMGLAK